MADQWVATLVEFGVPYFHMVECAHGNGIFAGIDKELRIELVTKLIALIKQFTLYGFSAFVHASQFKASVERPDAYVACAEMCATGLLSFVQLRKIEGGIAYFFESGHNSQGLAYKHIAKRVEKESSSVTFSEKTKVPLLQAADLLAWQSTKYIKDRISKQRAMRRDFASLLEHPHSLVFMHMDNEGSPQLIFEDWPLSRRAQTTATLTMHTDGAIDYACEDEDSTPIVVLDVPLGWREGAGKLIQVYFNGMGGKKLALAFDEDRLRLAIMALNQALESKGKPEEKGG